MVKAVYYVPEIPANPSTTRYNHALGIANWTTSAALVTTTDQPPEKVASQFKEVRTLDATGTLSRSREARRFAEEWLESKTSGQSVFVTTFHYAPAFAGFRSDHRWVVDVYDDPIQYALSNPRSYHTVTARALMRLLDRADRAVHTAHPSTPHRFTADQRFGVNGALASGLEPVERSVDEQFRCVCAGTKAGIGEALTAVKAIDASVRLDVFGETQASTQRSAEEVSISTEIVFHGYQPGETIYTCIEGADVGFCILPRRKDWLYAYPVRVGEYLAGGTVPLASAFPGIRDLAREAGALVAPRATAVETALKWLLKDRKRLVELKSVARQRAEEVSWERERRWFATQALTCEDSPEVYPELSPPERQ
jgi:glycosyltransferase involved in cell wall biosynthesis